MPEDVSSSLRLLLTPARHHQCRTVDRARSQDDDGKPPASSASAAVAGPGGPAVVKTRYVSSDPGSKC